MNRESIIIIICIGIVVLFYLCRVDSDPIKEDVLMKKTPVQSTDDVIKETLKQVQKKVFNATPDSLDNKDNQPK